MSKQLLVGLPQFFVETGGGVKAADNAIIKLARFRKGATNHAASVTGSQYLLRAIDERTTSVSTLLSMY